MVDSRSIIILKNLKSARRRADSVCMSNKAVIHEVSTGNGAYFTVSQEVGMGGFWVSLRDSETDTILRGFDPVWFSTRKDAISLANSEADKMNRENR